MGTFIDKILGLKDPQLVANFQKLCQIEILSENKNSQQETDSSRKTIENDELHKRLVHTNGVIQGSKNGLISNGNACQNDTVVSNGVHDHNTENSNCDNKEVKDLKCRNKAKYIVHNKFLFWMFRCGAELGNEFFYLTFFTFCLWNLNSLVTRQMAIIWHAGMYLGQAVKDIICWERPSSPPCARLELRYEEEYGMPSTHATVGVIIPFGLLLIAHRHYEFELTYGLVFATFWTFVCGLSRIYLGMHSVLDVIVGAAIGVILIPVMLPYVEELDKLQVSSPYGALLVLAGSTFLLYIYPNPPIWNTAKGDTATVEGVGAGISIGAWLNCQVGLGIVAEISQPLPVPTVTISWLCLSLLRSVIGVLILVIIRSFSKPFSIALLCRYYNIEKTDVEAQKKLGMEKPQKFIAYFTIAVGGGFIVPNLLLLLGIMRMSFYSEF